MSPKVGPLHCQSISQPIAISQLKDPRSLRAPPSEASVNLIDLPEEEFVESFFIQSAFKMLQKRLLPFCLGLEDFEKGFDCVWFKVYIVVSDGRWSREFGRL